jgi:hypothetical protein
VGKENSWRLVRRFFLYDTISGVEGNDNYVKGELSTVIRYAKDLTLRVKIDPTNQEMIYTPLLIVNYRERSKTQIQNNPITSVSFTSEYIMDNSSFVSTLKGLFTGAMILFGLLVIG